MDNNRLYELDVFRGISALSVALFHYTYGFDHNNSWILFHKGYLGVEFFFLISGFVIFMSIQHNDVKSFIFKRFCRLYPAYWFSVFLSYFLLSIPYIINNQFQCSFKIEPITIKDLLINLTMLQHFFCIRNIEGAYWSLAIELCFYLCIVFLMLSKTIKYYKIYCWAIIALVFIFRKTDILNSNYYYHYSLFFVIGICFYQIYNNKHNKKILLYHSLIIMSAMCVLLKYFYKSNVDRVIILCIVSLFYLFIFGLLHNKYVCNSLLIFFGKISYSFYLIHENIGSIIYNQLEINGVHSLFLKLFISLFLVTMLAYGMYYIFENKLLKLLNDGKIYHLLCQ